MATTSKNKNMNISIETKSMSCHQAIVAEVTKNLKALSPISHAGSSDTEDDDNDSPTNDVTDNMQYHHYPPIQNFSSLDNSYSYSLSNTHDPGFEVIPKGDILKFHANNLHNLNKNHHHDHNHTAKCSTSPNGSTECNHRNHQRSPSGRLSPYGSPNDPDSINTRHVSGPTIDSKHAQFALSAGMMLGIRECVGGVRAASEMDSEEVDENGEGGTTKIEKSTLEEECNKVTKYVFPAGTSFVSSNVALPYSYKIKAYAPKVFSKIRSAAGIDKQRFLHSICGKDSFIEFISNAKSGQFFFYCHDGRYMIKTQTREEKNFLHAILPQYQTYTSTNPHSFISHFYGMYRVKVPELKICTHFVIMKSVFTTMKEIHTIWDLKGSTDGRRAERGDGVHKDLDIMEEGRRLHVGKVTKVAITEQLRKDADFLADLQIMDYSLLLGVHLCTDDDNNKQRSIEYEVENSYEGSDVPTDVDIETIDQDLMMTNTPLRRQLRQESIRAGIGGEDGVESGGIRQFVKDAEDCNTLAAVCDDEESESDISDDSSQGDNLFVHSPNSVKEEVREGIPEEEDFAISTWLSSSSTFNARSDCPYSSREDGGIECVKGDGTKTLSREIYFGGIIDILQCYNTRKWGETMLKKSFGSSESSISCVNPVVYADRFVEFVDRLLV